MNSSDSSWMSRLVSLPIARPKKPSGLTSSTGKPSAVRRASTEYQCDTSRLEVCPCASVEVSVVW